MKKYLFSVAALLAVFSSASAQNTDNFKAAPRHTVYAELGGAGLFSSLNY